MKKSKKKKKSNTWKIKQHRDPYFKKSKTLGYRSRASFKLIELNKKYRFLKKNSNLLDLGSCPGGWSQVASKIITNGKILSIDIQDMEPINNVKFVKADILQNIQANNYQEDIYIRLQGYIDEWGEMAVRSPVSTSIVSYPRPRAIAFTEGKNFTISSWQRLDDNASPPRIKASANYLNSRLASIQAKESGYDGGIMLGPNGKVSEGPGGCIFLIRNGNLITPTITSGILESITRDSILEIADILKINVQTRDVDRTELYIADEIFYCGTGQEIMPILSVDKMLAGDGTPGKITKILQNEFTEIVRGNNQIFKSWISPTYKK